MIKLEVEIDGDKFKYSYKIGGSQENSEMALSASSLVFFANLVSKCVAHQESEWEKKRDNSWARALAEDLGQKATK